MMPLWNFVHEELDQSDNVADFMLQDPHEVGCSTPRTVWHDSMGFVKKEE